VDRDARNELAASLALLVGGQMTNDQFDERYYEAWEKCEDTAVCGIAGFAYSLYSSGLGAYRLRGWNAVSEQVQEAAQRAILFLRTDGDYPWPKPPSEPLSSWAAVPWINLGVPLLIVTLLFTILGFFIKDFPWGFLLKLWAVVVAFAAGAAFGSRQRRKSYREWCKAGEIEAWPFLHRAEYERARREHEAVADPDC
jgi:hypothetical protein